MYTHQQLMYQILRYANQVGASESEVSLSDDSGLNVSVRLGEVENIIRSLDYALSVTVYFGKRSGSASTTDLSEASWRKCVDKACHIAKFTEEDECIGLADPEFLAYVYPDLDLYHPWNLSVDDAISLALKGEAAGFAVDKCIKNSEGFTVETAHGNSYFATSNGFFGINSSSHHTLSGVFIARENQEMQQEHDYSTALLASKLDAVELVGERAAKRALEKLGTKNTIKHRGKVPIIFENRIASSLFAAFIRAISGGAIYRKASFLLDKVGGQVFPEFMSICERPHVVGALGSVPYDAEGVRVFDKDIIKDGILQTYLLSSYSARKLGLKTTGNAGGISNLYVDYSNFDRDALLRQMDTGILVTEFLGHGTNIVTGHYSQGIAGFWVENGVVQYPISEITISSNLADMFKNIVAIGNDIEERSVIKTGSVLIDGMNVGAS
ncbi:MAG: metalloprotease PmbA [Gammaproteobacteria bacterium]|nr:metalloprotease PmbA [Gammaproteobacteria bacterium]